MANETLPMILIVAIVLCVMPAAVTGSTDDLPDAIDLTPDSNYYFFKGTKVCTVQSTNLARLPSSLSLNSSPRIPILATFPSASTFIQQPITAAISTFNPARVNIFGGPLGAQQIGVYLYNTMSTTFNPLSVYPVAQLQHKAREVHAATMYLEKTTGTMKLFFLDGDNIATQIGPGIQVRKKANEQ
ncbi:hypothetical protein BV898_07612 [Hypsibius exemplaris]|uniref:Uncharacterized protein n=1 Tax=Hypsibius exemplaris TaxID=2072580 RepID=A0A1W0WT78_HYPEX|nr:hypothetical protein BV898_07612 [Hypsibius exemplaris]